MSPLRRTVRMRPMTVVGWAALAFATVLIGLPIAYLLYTSFRTNAPGAAGAHWTLANWHQLVTGNNVKALVNTVEISAFVTIFSILIAAPLAWLVSRTDMPFRRQFSVLFLLPMLLSPLLMTLAWTGLASPTAGFVNIGWRALPLVGGTLINIYTKAGIVLVMVLYFVPFAYLVLVTALQGVDSSFEDASRVTGAGVITTLRRITLPVIMPAILSAALLIFSLASEQLAVPTLLGPQAQVPTLQYNIYISMVDSPSHPPAAAAAGCFLLLITLVGIVLYGRALGQARRYVTISGKATAPRRIRLGGWRWVGAAFGALYLIVAVAAPYAALILGSLEKFVTPVLNGKVFTLHNYTQLIHDSGTLSSLKNTLIYGLGAATLALIFSSLISYITVRSRARSSRMLELVANLPLAVPAISLGLGILWAYLALPLGIYGTAWILIVAYLTRFSPQGLRSISSSLTQVDPELELAARTTGASPLRAVRDITAPLVRSALMAAWTILFVQVTLEISMTIMLYTTQTSTAAISIWFAYFGGNTTLAYTVAVVLTTFSFLVILVGQRFFGLLRHVG